MVYSQRASWRLEVAELTSLFYVKVEQCHKLLLELGVDSVTMLNELEGVLTK